MAGGNYLMDKKLIVTVTTGVLISVIGAVVVYKLKTSGVLGTPKCKHSDTSA